MATGILKVRTGCLEYPGDEFEEVRRLVSFGSGRRIMVEEFFWFDRYAFLGNERQHKRRVVYCAGRGKEDRAIWE